MSETEEAPAPESFRYFVEHLADGSIARWGHCSPGLFEHQAALDGVAIVEVSPEVHDAVAGQPGGFWVVAGSVTARASMSPTISAVSIAADGVDECAISGLPDPCFVTVTGAVEAGPVEVTGGALALTSTTPGRIKVHITSGPGTLPWTGIVDAT